MSAEVVPVSAAFSVHLIATSLFLSRITQPCSSYCDCPMCGSTPNYTPLRDLTSLSPCSCTVTNQGGKCTISPVAARGLKHRFLLIRLWGVRTSSPTRVLEDQAGCSYHEPIYQQWNPMVEFGLCLCFDMITWNPELACHRHTSINCTVALMLPWSCIIFRNAFGASAHATMDISHWSSQTSMNVQERSMLNGIIRDINISFHN